MNKLILVSFFTYILSFGICMGKNESQQMKPYAADTVSVANFGVKSNNFTNSSPAIRKAIESCAGKTNVTLILPGGRIDLWPEGSFKKELYISNTTENDTLSKVKNIAFLLEGKQNFTIDGNNTLVILHGKMESFTFLNCKDITLKNVRFDYERPTMSELTIKSVTDKGATVTVHPDTRYLIENGKIIFYGEGWKSNSLHTISLTPDKNIMEYGSFTPFLKAQATQTACGEIRFTGDFSKTNYRVGDVLTMRDTYRDNSGAFICQSKNIRLENVKMHYMHGLGIVSQFSENITLFKVEAVPRENSGRVISSFADCFHFSGCKGLILLDSCRTSGSHDDPMNVHGTHLQIAATDANNKLTVKFMHHQTYGFEAFFSGDSIAFVNPQTLMPLGCAKLKSARLVDKRTMELEVEGTLPEGAKIGYCVENLTWTPEVIIRNSRFERTNTRGLLLTTRRKVLIDNNTFYRTGMHAILIANDASSWFESGAVHDVTIRNNVFEDCGYNSAPGNYVIAIAPENHQLVDGYYVHRNIRIENNVFKVYDLPLISARSTDGLLIRNNTILKSAFMEPAGNKVSFQLTACKNVILQNNIFNTDWKPLIFLEMMLKKQLKTDILNVQVKR
jgi:hypothetical protein